MHILDTIARTLFAQQHARTFSEPDPWPDLIDRLTDRLGICPAALSRQLAVSAQKLSDARKSRQELSTESKTKVLCMLGDPVSPNVYVSLFSRAIREEIGDSLLRLYDPNSPVRVTPHFWEACLNLVASSAAKSNVENFSPTHQRKLRDYEIANRLGISGSIISKLRSNPTPGSAPTKLKILEAAELTASREVLLDLLPGKAHSVAISHGWLP